MLGDPDSSTENVAAMTLSETKDLCDTHHYIPDTGKKDPLVVQEESVRLPVSRPECTYTQPYINTSS